MSPFVRCVLRPYEPNRLDGSIVLAYPDCYRKEYAFLIMLLRFISVAPQRAAIIAKLTFFVKV